MCSVCGTVGWTVAFDCEGPEFECSNREYIMGKKIVLLLTAQKQREHKQYFTTSYAFKFPFSFTIGKEWISSLFATFKWKRFYEKSV